MNGASRPIREAQHNGTTVTVVVPHSVTLAVGQTIRVKGVKGIKVPDGDYVVTSNDPVTNTITFTCAPAPTRTYLSQTGSVKGVIQIRRS